jgi:hypothetical protein
MMPARNPVVGRTPWSAGDPLVALLAREIGFIHGTGQSDEGVGCGPGGPPHRSCYFPPEAICPR